MENITEIGNDNALEKGFKQCLLEVIMAHVPVARVPAHTLDAALGKRLTRIKILARILAVSKSVS
jgi:hypothetical protein